LVAVERRRCTGTLEKSIRTSSKFVASEGCADDEFGRVNVTVTVTKRKRWQRVTVDSEMVIGVGDGKIKNKIRFILNYRNVKELFLQNIFESTNLFRPTAWAKHSIS